MKPFLKYRGGKGQELKHFVHHLPKQFDTYIEPFVGAGAVFFHLMHPKSVINDINPKLITMYRQIRDCYPEVRRQLDGLQYEYLANEADFQARKLAVGDQRIAHANEALFYRLREAYNRPNGAWLEAVTYFFMNKTAYNGMIRYNKKGDFNVPFGRYRHFNGGLLTSAHHLLLQTTRIENRDFSEVLAWAGKDDFVFLDPPYDTTFSDYGNAEVADTFGEADHRRLAEQFMRLPCKALMIIGKTALTESLYRGMIAGVYPKSYRVNIRNRFKIAVEHLVIKNY